MNTPYPHSHLDKKVYNNRAGHYKFNETFKFILNNTNVNSNILDIGGGTGQYAIPLSKFSDRITVVDLNEEALIILKNLNNKITTIRDDFMNIQFTEQFSLILCFDLLNCFDDWDSFFEKVKSHLKPDGVFIFSFKNYYSWRFLPKRILNYPKPIEFVFPTFRMSFKRLKQLVSEKKLRISSLKGIYWMPLKWASDSHWVLFFKFVEKTFWLNKWYSQSPWVLITVNKIENC